MNEGRPRFLLAIPAWALFFFFFAVPGGCHRVLLVRLQAVVPDGRDRSPPTSCRSTGDTARRCSGTFFTTFQNTLQISIIGTVLCLLIGFPVRVLARGAGRPEVAWAAAWARDRAVLDELPRPHDRLAHPARSAGPALEPAARPSGLRDSPFEILFTRFAVQLGVVYNYLPLDDLAVVRRSRPTRPGACARRPRISVPDRFKTFRQVTLPLAMPGIIAGMLLVFIPLTGDYITARGPRRSEGQHGRADGGEPVPRRHRTGP